MTRYCGYPVWRVYIPILRDETAKGWGTRAFVVNDLYFAQPIICHPERRAAESKDLHFETATCAIKQSSIVLLHTWALAESGAGRRPWHRRTRLRSPGGRWRSPPPSPG